MDILLEKSLINAHCRGLDSIVIKDVPQMVRIFVAREEHDLYWNNCDNQSPFSVALHPHHCDVTLMPIFGDIYNVLMRKIPSAHRRLMAPYRYASPIGGKRGCFEKVGDASTTRIITEKITGSTFMPATAIHSVYVPIGKSAAWWVWEGKENEDYIPIVWSDYKLESFDFSGLNQPMTEERLREDLEMIGVFR